MCAIKYVQEVKGTCTNCRAWSRPLPASVAIAELAGTINQQVECVLMSVFKYIIFHQSERCARWHATCSDPNKEGHNLLDALNNIWVGICGPMQELIMRLVWQSQNLPNNTLTDTESSVCQEQKNNTSLTLTEEELSCGTLSIESPLSAKHQDFTLRVLRMLTRFAAHALQPPMWPQYDWGENAAIFRP